LTPSQLIAQTRLAAASRLLRETSKPVADIAHACGFYDHSAFTRAFRSATGLTPTQFREQNLTAEDGRS
jgi:AraC-like DNA-binding protein